MTPSIAARLDANATAAGDAVWLTSPDTGDTVTWTEAARRSRDIACQLDAMGLAKGAPVAVAAQNSIWSTLCFTGAHQVRKVHCSAAHMRSSPSMISDHT